MDFSSIGSVNNYVNTIKMQQKWQAKKDNKDFTADGTKSIGEWIDEQTKKKDSNVFSLNGDDEHQTDKTMQDINNKLMAGKKLTPNEKKYLQQKNPQLYHKLEAEEAEEKQYEEDLKRCKTKEDVQRLKMGKVSAALSAVNSISNNPNIPEGEKLGLIMQVKHQMDGIGHVTDKFCQSAEYANLPTDAEKKEAEDIIREAEKEQLYNAADKQTDDNEQDENAEDSSSSYTITEEQKAERIVNDLKVKSEPVNNTEKKTSTKAEITDIEDNPDNSPEVQKVKKSKHKFYSGTSGYNEAVVASSFEAKV